MGDDIKQWPIGKVRLEDVIPIPVNDRFIEHKNLKGLRTSLNEFGMVELPVWNKRTKHLLGGNQKFALLCESGIKDSDMIIVDFPEEEESEINLTLNNPEIQGTFTAGVNDLLRTVEVGNKSLYESLNMDKLQKETQKLVPKPPPLPEEEIVLPDPDWDTVCPCCRHRWIIGAKDITIEKGGPEHE